MATSNVLAKMAVLISAQTAEFNKALQQSESRLSQFGKTTQGISKSLAGFGIGLGVSELIQVIGSGINTIKDFERTMSTVKAITGATTEEFNALKKSALALGASTRYTSKEVAELQIEYGRLGFTTKEILAATAATLDLATATGSDLAKSADVAGSTVRGFGLSADETRRVVDVMAESFNKSALGIENFSEAMKYVAPIAAQAGLSVEETTAILGTLADSGIRGSMAGTSLRKIISDLGTESGDLSTRLEKLAAKGLTGADAMDEVGRTAYASLLILAKNTDKTRELTNALNYSAGAGKKAAQVMGDNLAGDITMLSSAYDGLVLSMSQGAGVLREVVQEMTQLLNALTNGNGGFSTFVENWIRFVSIPQRTILSGVTGLIQLITGANEANAALKENERTTQLIEEHVKQAWKSGIEYLDVYIESLKGVPHEYEIIKAILKKFQDEQEKSTASVVSEKEVTTLGTLKAKLDALNKSFENTDVINKKALASTGSQILSIQKQIETLEQFRKSQLTGLAKYREALTKANEAYDKSTSPENLRFYSAQIIALNETIRRMEKLKQLSLSLASGPLIPIPDMTALDVNLKGPLERAMESMKRFMLQSKITTHAIKTEWLDLGSSIGGAITTIAEGMGEAVVGVGNFGDTIVKALAGFARQVGETLIAIGVGMLAAKVALKNPYTAIAAGVALVALSSALTANLSKAQSNMGSGGSMGMSATKSAEINSGSGQKTDRIDFNAVFEISGDKLIAVAKRAENKNGRTFSGG
jgi:hypothetical protein